MPVIKLTRQAGYRQVSAFCLATKCHAKRQAFFGTRLPINAN
jgi:hypothetical protein